MIEIGIFEKTFPRPTFGETLDAVSSYGMRHIQLHLEAAGLEPMPLHIPDEVISDMRTELARPRVSLDTTRSASDRAPITVAALSATYNMAHPDPAVRADGLTRLEVIAAVARELGTTVITLCTGTRDPDDKWRYHPDNGTPAAWADLAVSMSAALAIAERHDLTLSVEPEPANIMRDAHAARRLLDEMASPRLQIILDPANIVAGALDRDPADTLAAAFDLLGPDIAVAHAKDVDHAGRFCPAGTGIVPWPTYLTLLSASSFSGPLILHSLTEADVPACIAALKAAM